MTGFLATLSGIGVSMPNQSASLNHAADHSESGGALFRQFFNPQQLQSGHQELNTEITVNGETITVPENFAEVAELTDMMQWLEKLRMILSEQITQEESLPEQFFEQIDMQPLLERIENLSQQFQQIEDWQQQIPTLLEEMQTLLTDAQEQTQLLYQQQALPTAVSLQMMAIPLAIIKQVSQQSESPELKLPTHQAQTTQPLLQLDVAKVKEGFTSDTNMQQLMQPLKFTDEAMPARQLVTEYMKLLSPDMLNQVKDILNGSANALKSDETKLLDKQLLNAIPQANGNFMPATYALLPVGQQGLMIAQAQAPTTQVNVPVDNAQFSTAVFEKVAWMVNQHLQKAEIKLNPPELGPLEVQIKMRGGETSVIFSSHFSGVRDTLEQHLPRLRDIMQENGINLTDANVSDQSLNKQDSAFAEQEEFAEHSEYQKFNAEQQDDEEAELTKGNTLLNHQGLVDYYV